MKIPPRSLFLLPMILMLALFSLSVSAAEEEKGVFRQDNLAAWCIVPFDKAKRTPEQRASMLEKLAIRHFVYDYRAEHVPQWDDEMAAE